MLTGQWEAGEKGHITMQNIVSGHVAKTALVRWSVAGRPAFEGSAKVMGGNSKSQFMGKDQEH